MIENNEVTVAETFEMMPGYFLKEKASGIKGAVQFDIQGDSGGQWYAVIDNEKCTVEPGVLENPDVTIATDCDNWIDMCMGEISGMELFSEGELSVNGDVALAMKFDEIFAKFDDQANNNISGV